MAIQSWINQYLGVNAHLHSVLHDEAALWDVFHDAHIKFLVEAVEKTLPLDYKVGTTEKSLQIREFEPYEQRYPIGGFRRNVSQDFSFQPVTTAPTLILSPEIMIDWGKCYKAVIISEISRSNKTGKVVTRIELLTPFNKPPEIGYGQYRERRTIALVNGTVMVEIDYSYLSPPITELIPNYVEREPHSYPYSISVTVPRPTLHEGELRYYGFNIDVPMPTIDIPLSGNDVLTINFGDVYNQTYGSSGFSQRVDYEQEPVRGYRWDDRERIRARLAAVKLAHVQGIDLERGPFPISDEKDELNHQENTFRGEVFYGRDDTGYI